MKEIKNIANSETNFRSLRELFHFIAIARFRESEPNGERLAGRRAVQRGAKKGSRQGTAGKAQPLAAAAPVR